jgi:hypothetical protein
MMSDEELTELAALNLHLPVRPINVSNYRQRRSTIVSKSAWSKKIHK